jgi:hypothetical protein
MLVGSTQITSRRPPYVEILREQGKISREVLDEALRIQAEERKYLGQVLCEIGRLNSADIEAALNLQKSGALSPDSTSLAGRAVGRRGPLLGGRTVLTPGWRERLAPPEAARAREQAPIGAGPAVRVSRRPDLSAPFTVTLITGLMSAALFLWVVVRQSVPPGGILPLAVTDPFGALTLALLAAAAVMARIGDI